MLKGYKYHVWDLGNEMRGNVSGKKIVVRKKFFTIVDIHQLLAHTKPRLMSAPRFSFNKVYLKNGNIST